MNIQLKRPVNPKCESFICVFLHGCAFGDGAGTPARGALARPSRRLGTRRHVSVAAGARRACRALVTCASLSAAASDHGCSDPSHNVSAEDVPGERAAEPAGPGQRARAAARRAAAAAAARRAAHPARRRRGAGRARRDAAGGRAHLVLQRGRRAAAVPAADPHLRADRLQPGADQPRVRRAADLLLALHAGAAARAEVDERAAALGALVRADHADGRGAALRGAAARAARLPPAQAARLPRLPRVLRRLPRRLLRGVKLSAMFGVPVHVQRAPVRVPLARDREPDLPLGVRFRALAPIPAAGRGGAGEGEVRRAARRAGGAGRAAAARAGQAPAAAQAETGRGKCAVQTRTGRVAFEESQGGGLQLRAVCRPLPALPGTVGLQAVGEAGAYTTAPGKGRPRGGLYAVRAGLPAKCGVETAHAAGGRRDVLYLAAAAL